MYPNERDMYYSSYGYGGYNPNYQDQNQLNILKEKINNLEKHIKNLDNRISRLENNKNDNNMYMM